jgi:hypothetical protein
MVSCWRCKVASVCVGLLSNAGMMWLGTLRAWWCGFLSHGWSSCVLCVAAAAAAFLQSWSCSGLCIHDAPVQAVCMVQHSQLPCM